MKRTLHNFFNRSPKRQRHDLAEEQQPHEHEPAVSHPPKRESQAANHHPSYPHAIANFPIHLQEALEGVAIAAVAVPEFLESKPLPKHQLLDVTWYENFLARQTARELFEFLRNELPFYRVKYAITRGAPQKNAAGNTFQVSTPRYTSVFGVDETAMFAPAVDESNGEKEDVEKQRLDKGVELYDSKTKVPVPHDRYKSTPRPIPNCLQTLRRAVEACAASSTSSPTMMAGIGDSAGAEGNAGNPSSFNFILVNYYADGNDSISYHSDDEGFLGKDPTIASLSLGAARDFLLKPKPTTLPPHDPIKMMLTSGDLLIMKGPTQRCWLHSIPKRKGDVSKIGTGGGGRINITFRKALVRAGTDNYYRYNVGDGGVWRWDDREGRMKEWEC